MRALNFILVSSGFAAIFFGIALLSALLTGAVHSQLSSPKAMPMSIVN
jgi:hypothetical protein